MAAGVKSSGLSALVGRLLGGLGGMDVVGVQFICVLITMGITNICSNTVTASIFVPIVAGLVWGSRSVDMERDSEDWEEIPIT